MAQFTILQACKRITAMTVDVSLHTRHWPVTLSASDLQKYVGDLTLAVNRLNLCVESLAKGKDNGGPAF
ncbi:MAG: hypothetical protein JSS22_09680 [Proteobacteria bacterium]|nr:hypothetical protein [Pseudomonadota bacterium]